MPGGFLKPGFFENRHKTKARENEKFLKVYF